MALFETIDTPRLMVEPFSGRHLTATYVAWLNDPDVVRYSEQRHRRHTLDSCRAYWRSFGGSAHLFGAIVTRQRKSQHIGNINAYIDPPNGLADVGILIGEKSVWGKGLGLEAWSAMCTYLLDVLKIRKITAGMMSANTPMIRICQKSGMLPDGRRRYHYVLEGAGIDLVYFSRLAQSMPMKMVHDAEPS